MQFSKRLVVMSSGSSGWDSWTHPPVRFEQNQPSPKLQAATKTEWQWKRSWEYFGKSETIIFHYKSSKIKSAMNLRLISSLLNSVRKWCNINLIHIMTVLINKVITNSCNTNIILIWYNSWWSISLLTGTNSFIILQVGS